MAYKTEQEAFWAGEFGNEYSRRNNSEQSISSGVAMFSRILQATRGVRSIVELGCNIGMNLRALNRINHDLQLTGYEINEGAANEAGALGIAKVMQGTILEPLEGRHDLSFTRGVLIHINPDQLPQIYDNLFRLSARYIAVCEYYNPSPVEVSYRGNADRLFKRDFAGEMIDRYGLTLIDYGFVYHRDPNFPQDDMTWFLMEKA